MVFQYPLWTLVEFLDLPEPCTFSSHRFLPYCGTKLGLYFVCFGNIIHPNLRSVFKFFNSTILVFFSLATMFLNTRSLFYLAVLTEAQATRSRYANAADIYLNVEVVRSSNNKALTLLSLHPFKKSLYVWLFTWNAIKILVHTR